MLLLNIAEKGGKPIYVQIIEQIAEKIENRTLQPGEKLPSTRQMAEKLGIHRTTVATAYQELWSLGYIDQKPGCRPSIRERAEIVNSGNRAKSGYVNWSEVASAGSKAVWELHPQKEHAGSDIRGNRIIDLGKLDIDERLFPGESFRICLNKAMKKYGPELLGYGEPAGFLPLREHIAGRMQKHGISAVSDEVLITNGIQQSLDLILRMFAEPGRSIIIESPTYKELIPLLHYHGLKVIEVPSGQEGMDLDILTSQLQKEKPVLIHTMPNFHNPTGTTTSQAHRERLLAIAEEHRIPVVEDGFEEEMKYFGKVVLPIKSMDKHQIVIYCGTYSKVLFPGVRTGWIIAEKECIERLTALRRTAELSTGMLLQSAILEFCESGFYDRHISRIHRIYRKRMQTAVRAIHKHIHPDWVQWSEPSGGYLIWLKLKPAQEVDWQKVFDSFGVRLMHGENFFYSGSEDTFIRISISACDEDEITEGIIRLSKALNSVYKT